MSTGRAEAFSDGVFAIAITLLVLGLRLSGHGLLNRQLLHAWPQYFAYVVSFLSIGIMWMNHHTILGHVERVNRPLLVLNLLLLMGIVAIPFPTALVADNLTGRGGSAAAVTYGLVMIAISCGFAGLWIYVATHGQALGAPSTTCSTTCPARPRRARASLRPPRDPGRDRVHSFLATSGPVMRASSGKVAAMMPRDTTIPPAVSR
jgi:uncharacterized membrane protein